MVRTGLITIIHLLLHSLSNNYSSNYDQLSSSKALSSTSHSALADLWLFGASITYPSIWTVKWRYLQCCTCLLESGNWRLLLEEIIGLFSSVASLSSPRDTKGAGCWCCTFGCSHNNFISTVITSSGTPAPLRALFCIRRISKAAAQVQYKTHFYPLPKRWREIAGH